MANSRIKLHMMNEIHDKATNKKYVEREVVYIDPSYIIAYYQLNQHDSGYYLGNRSSVEMNNGSSFIVEEDVEEIRIMEDMCEMGINGSNSTF